MRLLLDTHLLLWWLDDSHSLSREARVLIEEPENTVFVSAASIWEIRIKQGLGKLELPGTFYDALKESSFEMLSINANHANAILALPPIHRDPFDRMLVAQAQVEGLVLLTADEGLAGYGAWVRIVDER